VNTLYRQDQAVGGGALLLAGLRQWERARRMARQPACTDVIKGQLLAVTAETGVCAGWIASSAGDYALARRLYAQAQSVAGEIEDCTVEDRAVKGVLTAHVFSNASMLAVHLARTGPDRSPARAGVQLACQAADLARREHAPRLCALIAARHAQAGSLLDDKATFRSAITRARRELDRAPRASEPEWSRFVDDVEITGQEATGHMALGEFVRGEELCRRVLANKLSALRNADYSAHLACSLLGQGACKDAIDAGTTVLSALENGVTSGHALSILRPVRVAARKADDEEFCARYDSIERSLTAA